MHILRGCNVSDSFVTVVSDQMALRRPVFAPSVWTRHAVIVVNNVCNIHSRVQPWHADEYGTPVEQLSHFNRVPL